MMSKDLCAEEASNIHYQRSNGLRFVDPIHVPQRAEAWALKAGSEQSLSQRMFGEEVDVFGRFEGATHESSRRGLSTRRSNEHLPAGGQDTAESLQDADWIIDVFDDLDEVYCGKSTPNIFQPIECGKLICREPGLRGWIRLDAYDLNRWYCVSDRHGDVSDPGTDIQHPVRGREELDATQVPHEPNISQAKLPAFTLRIKMLLHTLHGRGGYGIYMTAVLIAALQRIQMYCLETVRGFSRTYGAGSLGWRRQADCLHLHKAVIRPVLLSAPFQSQSMGSTIVT